MKEWFIKFLGELGDYLGVLFKKGIHDELKILMPIAFAAVKSVASDSSLTSGDAKFEAAFNIIGSQLADQQKVIANSLVNLAIELAVQKFQDAQPK